MADDLFEPKLMYLARRHPNYSRGAYTERWRQHAALGMAQPRWKNIARYEHCDIPLPKPEDAHFLTDYDGIGIIWHKSPTHRAAHIADTSSRHIMEADEAECYAEPNVDATLIVRETILRAPPRTVSSPTKLTRFVWTNTAMKPDIPALDGLIGYVQNIPLAPDRGPRWGLDCAYVEELWFSTAEQTVAAARHMHAQDGVHARVIMAVSNVVELFQDE